MYLDKTTLNSPTWQFWPTWLVTIFRDSVGWRPNVGINRGRHSENWVIHVTELVCPFISVHGLDCFVCKWLRWCDGLPGCFCWSTPGPSSNWSHESHTTICSTWNLICLTASHSDSKKKSKKSWALRYTTLGMEIKQVCANSVDYNSYFQSWQGLSTNFETWPKVYRTWTQAVNNQCTPLCKFCVE